MSGELKMASLFAGVGGIDLGFEQTGHFQTVYANEFDDKATLTYSENFDNILEHKNVREVDTSTAPDADVILSGFPCQAFSIAGYRQGFEDEQNGDLFFETLRFITHKRPRVALLENVKNLVGHDGGKTFRIILEALEQNGYKVKYKVLNAKEYGNVPQNRERIYVVAFREEEDYYKFEFPQPIPLTTTLQDVIDFENKVDDKYYYTKESFKQYDELVDAIDDPNTVYQWRRKYVRKNMSGVVPTLTANMGTGGHNVPLILTKHGIRKLTPRECFNVQGFPEDFVLPDLAMSHLYKQAGNSVVVPVIKRIARNIADAINHDTSDDDGVTAGQLSMFESE